MERNFRKTNLGSYLSKCLMKCIEEPIEIISFSQTSFPPYTRGYTALPNPIKLIIESTLEKYMGNTSYTLFDFRSEEVKKLIKKTCLSKESKTYIILQTRLDAIEFITAIRGLRALLAIALEKNGQKSASKQFHFLLPIANTHETSQIISIAQWAQIDTLVCSNEDENELKLLLSYFPTPPIDALFGNPTIEEKTTLFISKNSTIL